MLLTLKENRLIITPCVKILKCQGDKENKTSLTERRRTFFLTLH